MPAKERPDRNLAMELVRVTESAALAAASWVGRGDKKGADGAAVDAMRNVLDTVSMDGIVVIGEGEKDEAPMLYNGERVGNGSKPLADVAVDPIDGTTNYLYGHAGFAVSIAAEIDGAVTAGVVHDPLHRDVFTALRGGGSFRNGQPIQASGEIELSRALIATGFSYEPDRRRRQAAVLGRLIANVRDIRRMGAASVDLCSVACGRVDAYYERGLQPWDHAAGALIATEAGAIVGNLSGGAPEFDFCLAAPPALFDGLRTLLIDADATNA